MIAIDMHNCQFDLFLIYSCHYQDTLGEVSISEGEFLTRDDAVVKLLTQIKSPPNVQTAVNDNTDVNRDKSEGEVSIGEEQVDTPKGIQTGYRDRWKDKNEGTFIICYLFRMTQILLIV